MEDSPLKKILIGHEGLRLKPYHDTVGKLTIGVGRNLDDVGITREEAMMLLDNDIARSVAECRKNFPWYDDLNDARKTAVISLVFNMGIGGVLTFRKALAAMAAEQWDEAAKQFLDSRWRRQVGRRAEEIVYMIRTGEYRSESGTA